MAENKKSILIYCDLVHTIRKLIEKDRLNKTNNTGELFFHILEYTNDLNPEPINDIVDITFEPIRQQLKRDLIKYSNTIDSKVRAGLASAEKRKHMSTRVKSVGQEQTKATVIDKDKDKGKDTVTDKERVKEINNIDSRKLKFASSLEPFLKIYGRETLNEFYQYWIEPNKSKTKMRFELQKTWDEGLRLRKWSSNNFNKKNNNGTAKQDTENRKQSVGELKNLAERILDDYAAQNGG
jgi:hypothetical protein